MSKLGRKHITFINEITSKEQAIQLKKTYYIASPPVSPQGELRVELGSNCPTIPLDLMEGGVGETNTINKENIVQKLDIIGPLGVQSIVIPDIFDLHITQDLTDSSTIHSVDGKPKGKGGKFKQTITIKINPYLFNTEIKEDLIPSKKGEDAKGIKRGVNSNFNKKAILKLWGTTWKLLQLMLIGVSTGFKSYIKLSGIGFKANISQGNEDKTKSLVLNIGFSHSVFVEIPDNINIDPNKISNTSQGSLIEVTSNSLSQLNNFVKKVYKLRPADKSFKGFGISVISGGGG